MNKDEKQRIIKRLIYRATYRGSKESDLLLSQFLSKHLEFLSYQELLDVALILDCDDKDIYEWTTNKKPSPKHLNKKLISMLKSLIQL
ncbi:flavinator of succinate dehydrogenase family protein [Orientia tsutsugamushi str. UT144]|uniref:FAD assembly factor SdhE n=1 Tax=Orientia tsutsugamushi str. UT144 TaxID=1441384 RepID=A0A0F3RN48_ORITS|nr:succinate dehydrogenase assembly factor 2 [Orientia tsutsugamushi]KJW07703.1 flavinator of succinate dehydrogenase family protein [Orientia tsutsugamushi str. UT144]